MAHFAKLDENNVVIAVNVLNNEILLDENGIEQEQKGINFLIEWSDGHTNWKQTSYNNNFRKRYAGIGMIYDAVKDAFIPTKPFNSWVFNEEKLTWEPPVPKPMDVDPNLNIITWNESTTSWDIETAVEPQ